MSTTSTLIEDPTLASSLGARPIEREPLPSKGEMELAGDGGSPKQTWVSGLSALLGARGQGARVCWVRRCQ